jgi:hypothetical protein
LLVNVLHVTHNYNYNCVYIYKIFNKIYNCHIYICVCVSQYLARRLSMGAHDPGKIENKPQGHGVRKCLTNAKNHRKEFR